MALLLKGAPAAKAIREACRLESEALIERGIVPTLATVRVGERDDDLAYERAIERSCASAGVTLRRTVLPDGVEAGRLLSEIAALDDDPSVHGILLFRPLPCGDAIVCDAVAPEKDVDGVTAASMAAVYAGTGGVPCTLSRMSASFNAPCTAEACLALLRYYDIPLSGRRAAIVGRSLVVGCPLSMLLLHEDATVTIAHSRTPDLAAVCREADIVIAAAGRPGLLGAAQLREGQTIVDVGIHTLPDGTLCGDVCFDEAEPLAAAITPVPGGVGPVTSALLCRHTVLAATAAAARG